MFKNCVNNFNFKHDYKWLSYIFGRKVVFGISTITATEMQVPNLHRRSTKNRRYSGSKRSQSSSMAVKTILNYGTISWSWRCGKGCAYKNRDSNDKTTNIKIVFIAYYKQLNMYKNFKYNIYFKSSFETVFQVGDKLLPPQLSISKTMQE